jgi:diguanylate cyclase (GGDEF)-like protein
VTTYFDITDQWHNQNIIHHMAHHDQLTDLANRRLLGEPAEPCAGGSAQDGIRFAIHCIDLDRFKPVNDTYGHAAGDEVLKLVASRLRRISRQGDTIARIGGDEFVLVQVGIRDRGDAEALAKRVELEMTQPFKVGEEMIQIGTSVGTAMAPDDSLDSDALFRIADTALYTAKKAKRSGAGEDERLSA